MWKKTLPIIGLSGMLLVGCNHNGVVRNNNETPMQGVREDVDQRNNNTERDNHNGVNNGNVNDNGFNNNRNGNNVNENGNPQVEIIDDLNRKNNVQE